MYVISFFLGLERGYTGHYSMMQVFFVLIICSCFSVQGGSQLDWCTAAAWLIQGLYTHWWNTVEGFYVHCKGVSSTSHLPTK